MAGLRSALIENYQALQGPDDSLIGNECKGLRSISRLPIFSSSDVIPHPGKRLKSPSLRRIRRCPNQARPLPMPPELHPVTIA
ncbi:hypothetical protein C3F00_012120 [Pseudomonas sp. MWU13-2860]|nr:hypothetical protein C3F00_012120 [Pseudomonas sp. MWU13-2860]